MTLRNRHYSVLGVVAVVFGLENRLVQTEIGEGKLDKGLARIIFSGHSRNVSKPQFEFSSLAPFPSSCRVKLPQKCLK
jgi:hypothetical protein